MKSIIEEASSIAKAIENGWVRAGRPQEFTVRVFEQASGGFLGFFKKPAKIGIFFKEVESSAQSKPRQAPRSEYRQQRETVKQRPECKNQQFEQQNKPKSSIQGSSDQQSQQKWTPEMVDSCNQWIANMVSVLVQKKLNCTITPNQYVLSIALAGKVLDDKKKEQVLLRSWSQLLLQVLRNRCKRGLRGYKIVITSVA